MDLVFGAGDWGSKLTEEHKENLITYMFNVYLDREINGTLGHWLHLITRKSLEISTKYALQYDKIDWSIISGDSEFSKRNTGDNYSSEGGSDETATANTATSNASGTDSGTNSGSQDNKNGDYPNDIANDDIDQHKGHSEYSGTTGGTTTSTSSYDQSNDRKTTYGKTHTGTTSGTQTGRNTTPIELLNRQLGLVHNIDFSLVSEYESCYNILS